MIKSETVKLYEYILEYGCGRLALLFHLCLRGTP